MTRFSSISVLVAASLSIGVLAALGWSQGQDAPPRRTDTQGQGQGQPAFPDLLGALKNTPGCLGVEAARTMGGKNVIFAWFQDKKSLVKWYYSETHQQVMDEYFTDADFGKPLESVPDDGGPLMVIASLTMAEAPQHEETRLPVSQISVELYQPVSGGVYLGGRFAPDALHVKELIEVTPEP